jgi:hypothetical protein
MPERDEAYAFLDVYARGAADRVSAPTECSIIVRERSVLRYAASSAEAAGRCDQAEIASGEGPCVLATTQLRGELVPDLGTEERWPVWRETATGSGFRSSAALPAIVDETVTVALNLYSPDVDPWDAPVLVAMDGYAKEVAEAIRTRGVRRS